MRIDLNCDMGECVDPDRQIQEECIMPLVTSISIPCGFHAGNQDLMRRTIRLARAYGVAIGAHPSFRDPEGFGRREMSLTPEEIESLVAYQVGALGGIAALEGMSLSHVKPHGALYNIAVKDRGSAEAIAGAVAAVDRRLILFGLAGSALIKAGLAVGLTVAEEAFVDRAYHSDGSLVPRRSEGAVVPNEHDAVQRIRGLIREGLVMSHDGSAVRLHMDTICLHSDTPGSLRLAELTRQELILMGVRLQSIGHAKL